MGIVRNQGIKNLIFSYTGVALGYLNIIILFPAYFSSEQFGLINLMISVSSVYAQISSFGLINAVTKYFPFFKSEDRKHNFFLTYVVVISGTGFILMTILFFLFKPLIIEAYIDKSKLFVDYFILLVPLSLSLIAFTVFEVLARVVYRTVLTTFAREVVIRLLTTLDIFLFITKAVDFSGFMLIYVCIYFFSSLIILIQVVATKEFRLVFSLKGTEKKHFKEFLRYGSYNLLSGAAMFVGQKVDVMMIGSMIGLSIVGAYSLYLYIATVISMPLRAFSKIAIPIIANSWKENDTKQINDIYRRTSLIQFIFGLLIYIGVIINKDNLFMIIKKPEYVETFGIFYFVGIAFIADTTLGLTSEIISSSKHYRYDALFNVMLFAVSVITNLIFIPIWGGIGAALAAAISFITFNITKWLFLYSKHRMQPFSIKQLPVILFAAVCIGINYFIPQLHNIYLDIILRSGVISAVYISGLYFTRTSDDLNDRINTYLSVLFKRK